MANLFCDEHFTFKENEDKEHFYKLNNPTDYYVDNDDNDDTDTETDTNTHYDTDFMNNINIDVISKILSRETETIKKYYIMRETLYTMYDQLLIRSHELTFIFHNVPLNSQSKYILAHYMKDITFYIDYIDKLLFNHISF